jgi:hypothetical protein
MLLLDSIILILVMMAPIGVIAGLSLFMDAGGNADTEDYVPRAGFH